MAEHRLVPGTVTVGILRLVCVLVAILAAIAVVFIIVASSRIRVIRLALSYVLAGDRRTILVAEVVSAIVASAAKPRPIIPVASATVDAVAAAIIHAIISIAVPITPTMMHTLVAGSKTSAVPITVSLLEQTKWTHPALIASTGAFPIFAAKVAGVVFSTFMFAFTEPIPIAILVSVLPGLRRIIAVV